MLKICCICRETKALDEFGINRMHKDGKASACRLCINLYANKQRWAKGRKPYPSFLSRLWDNIQYCDHGDICLYCCWPCMRTRGKAGYGQISLTTPQGTYLNGSVHRIVYEVWHARPIPEGLDVLHHCDFPPCANPTHLWLGTARDNTRDAMKKGRLIDITTVRHLASFPKGEAHHKAKLTNDDVLAIRDLRSQGYPLQVLALRYHVSQASISMIVHKKIWKHV